MYLKHEMAYLALRNFLVDLADGAAYRATQEMKDVANQALDIVEETSVSSATVYEKLKILLQAGDKIEVLDQKTMMSDEAMDIFTKVSKMAYLALKEYYASIKQEAV